MKRTVYLFELDSVIKYEHSLKGVAFTEGVQAIFSEIIGNGNSVAITMNQLTDSQFISEVIRDDKAYFTVLQLFEYGMLKASMYDEVRTASQYIQEAIRKSVEENNHFTFSNLPVLEEERELLKKIWDALKFSDLSVLTEEIQREEKDKERLEFIYRFVNMVLQISVCETSNIPAKKTPKRTLSEFIEIAEDIIDKTDFSKYSFNNGIEKVNGVLEERRRRIVKGINNRSNWLSKNSQEPQDVLADKIVNLCYNYTLEDSINGVSKHYNDADFENTFAVDFIKRLELACEKKKEAQLKAVKASDFDMLVRFARYNTKSKNEGNTSFVYEDGFLQERRRWVGFIAKESVKSLGMSLIYIGIFLATEFGLSAVEDVSTIPIENVFAETVIKLMLFGILSSLISKGLSLLNKSKEIPDVLKCFVNMWFYLYDFICVLGDKYDSYKLY